MKKQKVNETLRKATNEKKQVRINESTLRKATEIYKRVEGFRGEINWTIVVDEVLLKYIEDNK